RGEAAFATCAILGAERASADPDVSLAVRSARDRQPDAAGASRPRPWSAAPESLQRGTMYAGEAPHARLASPRPPGPRCALALALAKRRERADGDDQSDGDRCQRRGAGGRNTALDRSPRLSG